MTTKEMKSDILKTAKAIRKEFKRSSPKGSEVIEINWSLPYVSVNTKNYFFQGEEASELLADAVEAGNKFNVGVEDVILWKSTNW